MNGDRLTIVFLGLTITSSWGNGHATTYRALLRQLAARGHHVMFLERDMPWYASTRDLRELEGIRIELYQGLRDLQVRFGHEVVNADVAVVGSYVPDGVEVSEWVLQTAQGVTAFYDIDTPVTLAKLETGQHEYLSPALIPRFHLYLSFTGGPALDYLECKWKSPMARPLYCGVDIELYCPRQMDCRWNLGYLGTYSPCRQPALQSLLLEPATAWPPGRFVVAGPQYPADMEWPANVEHIEHLPPAEHRDFYGQQVFTLNLTRSEMVRWGYSPSVRLFEAAACAVPVISDYWSGLETVFEPGKELLVARHAQDTLRYLETITVSEARAMGEAARNRVMTQHSAGHRAAELEGYLFELLRIPATEQQSTVFSDGLVSSAARP